jgi:tetratricopeptide (TPR) repeat protein
VIANIDYLPIPCFLPSRAFLEKVHDSQAEAHALLAGAHDNDWEWSAAEREYERALQLDPNSSRINILYTLHFVTGGNIDQGIAHVQSAEQLDPLNLNVIINLGATYFSARRYDQSIVQLNKAVEIDPNYAATHVFLSSDYEAQGKYDLWLDEAEKTATLNKDADQLVVLKAARLEYARAGYLAANKRISEVLEEQSKRGYIDPVNIAVAHAILDDKDKAFFWLEKAFAEKSGAIRTLKTVPSFDHLRSDPRFADLLRRMNIPQ